MASKTYELFRFQLLPIIKKLDGEDYIQSDFYTGVNTKKELIKHKNEIFWNAMQALKSFRHNSYIFSDRMEMNPFTAFTFAPKRVARHDTRELKTVVLENYPRVNIILNNEPEQQWIAIEQNSRAFPETDNTASALEKIINKFIKASQIKCYIEPIREDRKIWNYFKDYEVQAIKFRIINPNMSSISHNLDEDLKQIGRDLNAHQTNLDFKSKEGLQVENNNETIDGLVKYANSGAGTVRLKLKGVRKELVTNKTKKKVYFDEMDFDGPPDMLKETLEDLFK